MIIFTWNKLGHGLAHAVIAGMVVGSDLARWHHVHNLTMKHLGEHLTILTKINSVII